MSRFFLPPENYFSRYTSLIEKGTPLEVLRESLVELKSIDVELWTEKSEYIYAPGKWNIKQIFRHCIDTERIMAYRALRFARNDNTDLASFDHIAYVEAAPTDNLKLEQLFSEYLYLRVSTIDLFLSFEEEYLLRRGICSSEEVTVGAIGYIIAGHQKHHFSVFKERYLR